MAPGIDTPSQRGLLVRWWGWMLLCALLAGVLVAQRYVAVVDLADGAMTAVFRWAMLIAHFGSFAFVLLLPAFVVVLLWPRIVPVAIVAVLAISAYVLGLLVDTEVYRLYRFHIDAGVLNLLFGGAAKETFIFPAVMYWQATAIVIAVATATGVASWLLWRFVNRAPARPHRRRALVAVFVACLMTFHGLHVWADARARAEFTRQTDILPLRYAATAKRFMRSIGVPVLSRPLTAKSSFKTSDLLAYPLSPVECVNHERSPNIILIVIDSWRFDAMNEQVTPNIAQFAQHSTVFANHYSGGNATRIGVFSLFYSIPGTYWHQVLHERRGPVVIRELLERDYEIGIFRSAPLTSPEFDRTVFADMKPTRLRSEGAGPADWDRDLTEDFQHFLHARDPQRPMFAFLFYDAPHSFQYPVGYPLPFKPSLEHVNYFEMRDDTDPTPFFNRYLNSVHYVDSLVGEVLQSIEAKQLLDDSIILITSDHGQEFNETGGSTWGHNSNFSRYQTGVPMIWYAPGRPPQRHTYRTSHFDVMPTLLQEALDCRPTLNAISVGRSMFESAPRDILLMSTYSDFAIVQPSMITEVRQSGIFKFDPQYRPLDEAELAPHVLASVLEQRSRFIGRRHGKR